MGRYAETYGRWRDDPIGFWAEAASAIEWETPWRTAFNPDMGVYGRWFPGARCNTCFNALDRHVAEGRGDQTAIIYDSPVTGVKRRISYLELLDDVATFAAVLADRGVEKGDRVILYMPMVPEALVAMLATARLGAVHSVVFGGFAAHELASRIDDAEPKLIVTASCGIEPSRIVAYLPLAAAAIDQARHKPDGIIVVQREQHVADLKSGRDHDYAALMAAARKSDHAHECVPIDATDPLYILYTSGTTGQPKGIVRDTGGHMVALEWSMTNVYGVAPGEVFWAASDIGWVVGHSYIVYAPLIHGCTTVLYEGKPVGTPDAGAFWRVVEEHGVSALFTAPTALRAIKKEDPDGALIENYDLSGLRALFLAGERADPETVRWAEDKFGIPVIDHWWQTETGWSIGANPMGLEALPVKRGSPTVAMPGYDIRILDDAGHPVAPGKLGNIVIKLPLPPGCLPTLWRNDDRFQTSYLVEFPGYYQTSDAGYIDADGYLFIMGRTDDIINVAGHRLSTGGMEEVVASHPQVAECAVIGVADSLKGQLPLAFLVLKAGAEADPDAIEGEIIALVRDQIGPVAALKTVLVVPRLPKTRSGKILRGTMSKIADGESFRPPATIDDPAILDEIAEILGSRAGPAR
ncbi:MULTISPECIES: propionyl-CoA synthetase [Alphaproteobacteria]|uniref:propionyl-CoA synthetase n=1 Tax=Alphaproteobacteria TaxID=28211 RepID=UPI003266D325